MYRAVIISDLHCGNRWGLAPPEWHSDQVPWQKQFWEYYTNTIKQIGAVDCLFVNGDLIDGPQRKDAVTLLETNLKKQCEMSIRCIEQVKTKSIEIIKGTGYHTDNGLNLEEIIADQFDIEAVDDLRIEINGLKIYFRHVVGRSDIPYGQYTQLGKELINELLQSIQEDYDPAVLHIRSHVHYSVRVGMQDNFGNYRTIYTTPALQLRGPGQTAFTRKLRTWLYHVGITLLEIDKHGQFFLRCIPFKTKAYYERGYKCVQKK